MVSLSTIANIQKVAKPLYSLVKAVGPFILSQSTTAVEKYSGYKLNKARLEALTIALQEEAKNLSADRAKLREAIRELTGLDRVKAQHELDLVNNELNRLSTIAKVKDFFSQDEEANNDVEMDDSWIYNFNKLASSLNEDWRKTLLAKAFALELKEPGTINILALNAIASFDEGSFRAFGHLIDSSSRLYDLNIVPLCPFTGRFLVSGGYTDGDELSHELAHLNLVNFSGPSSLKFARGGVLLRYGRKLLELEFALDSGIIPQAAKINVITYTHLGNTIAKLYERSTSKEGEENFTNLKIAANMHPYRFVEGYLSDEDFARLGN